MRIRPGREYEDTERMLREAKKFFRRIARMLHSFAAEHNLLIEKYYHDGPSWDFIFQHPLGGFACINVEMVDEEHINMCAAWQFTDFKRGEYYDKHTEQAKFPIDNEVLLTELTDMLGQVLSWESDDLELIARRDPGVQERITEDEFQELIQRYPIPKL